MDVHQRFCYNQQYGEYNRKKEKFRKIFHKSTISLKNNKLNEKKKPWYMLPVPISLVINKMRK